VFIDAYSLKKRKNMSEKDREEMIGNYQIIKRLHAGHFTTVYLGRENNSHRLAALKVLHPSRPDIFRDFLLERARTLARLDHPHIARLIDYGEQDEREYLVTEYAPMGSIRQIYPKGYQIPVQVIRIYVKQIADALHYACSKQITHSYLKPENILFTEREHLLVSDFGPPNNLYISQTMNPQASVSSYLYLAPEQYLGKAQTTSDQYALGAMIYEWLSGNPPFVGSVHEVVTQHLQARPPSLREKFPDIACHIEEVVMRALAKDPKERFESIATFYTAFEQATA
jgi:serine/threonine protein kinase